MRDNLLELLSTTPTNPGVYVTLGFVVAMLAMAIIVAFLDVDAEPWVPEFDEFLVPDPAATAVAEVAKLHEGK